ncbi:alpha/beta hydrolase family protein [Yinghuangia sp. ASG 101]|uniref:alpha/beta hydrolase n=1 Tax=Yinghuangia sp. ASG 101 TaxID=2896848 RepID=UPI001E5EE6F0|nr:alpha/beta hydrolase [Yinghuangia sp. ASG 101]UGQ14173.1 alpha/beta hydrolase family protein [Yinghuangia sp. ASG 101]
MVTLPELRDAIFDAFDSAAETWGRVAGNLDEIEAQYARTVQAPAKRHHGNSWSGVAADGALTRIDAQSGVLRFSSAEARNIATGLESAGETLRAAQNALRAVLERARVEEMTVRDDGSVTWSPTAPPDPSLVAERQAYDAAQAGKWNTAYDIRQGIDGALRTATETDTQLAALLQKMAEAARTGPIGDDATQLAAITDHSRLAIDMRGGPDASAIPPPGADPKSVAAWWASLSQNDRQSFIAAYPERVGGLNGVPVVDRDQANQITVVRTVADLQARQGSLSEQEGKNYEGLVKLQGSIQAHAADPNAAPLYVMAIDSSGEGKFAVAVGNPDTAKNTAVMVPGTTTTLEGVNNQIDRARRLQFTSDVMTPEAGDVAVVTWLGYNAPEIGPSVATPERAQQAAVPLDSFIDGVRVTHEGERGRVTVIGHSYGTTVVGEAAATQHLDVDDIVAAGSPGMRTDHAADLGIGAGHVWVESAGNDPVARLPQAGDLFGGAYPMGAAPQDSRYDANRLQVDTDGHSGYWEPESQSIRNQAAIVVGQYDNAELARESTAGAGEAR